MIRQVRAAVRERRQAAEGLANACLPHVDNPAPALKLATPIAHALPEDWSRLLTKLDD